MRRFHLKQFQNDSTDTVDEEIGAVSDGLGSDTDEAFRRGREYASKGRKKSALKGACKNKGVAIFKSMLAGFNWQTKRMAK